MSVKTRPPKEQSPKTKEEQEKRKREIAVTKTLSEIVNKRKNAKVEFGYTVELDGTIVKMNRGGKTSCQITDCYNRIGIHNHPAGEFGVIGGTFSPADLCSMYITNRPINYAIDQEYVYELRAKDWKPLGETSGLTNLMRLTKAMEIKAKYNDFIRKAELKAYNRATQLKNEGRFKGPDGVTDLKKYWDYFTRSWHAMMGNWLKNNADSFGYEYHVHSIKTGGYKK